jgi:RHS repeat-associated protein
MENNGQFQLRYEERNRLDRVIVGGLTTSYGVNGLGERTTKDGRPTFGVFEHVYDLSGQLLGIYKSGALDEEIVWLGDLPVGTIQGGAAYSIAPDHLGAPYKIVNSANAQVWFWDHDPFGNGAPTAAAGFWHRLRFPGQVYDSESKLHSNGKRDYDPRLGRYLESDPIGLEGGINTYAYANNNPVNAIDPLGLDPEHGVEQAFHDFFYDPARYWSDLGRSVSAAFGAAADTCGVFCDQGFHASIGDAPGAMLLGVAQKSIALGRAAERTGAAFKDFNQARNAALDWLGARGFKAEQATVGKFGDNAGKPIGMKTADGKVGFRVEYDARNGAHINVWAGNEKGPHLTFDGNQSMVDRIVKQFVK